MECQQFKDEIALLDDRTGAGELSPRAAMHVEHCSDCQSRIRQLRTVQRMVSGLTPPQALPGLPEQIMVAAEQRPNLPWISTSMFGLFVQPARPRLLAHLCGVVFTVSTFLFILTPFNPNRIAPLRHDSDAVVYLSAETSDMLPFLNTSSTSSVVFGYGFPQLAPSAGLDQFTDEVHRAMGVEELMMLAEVDESGRISVVQVLSPSASPQLRGRLDTAMKKNLFVSVKDEDRPARSRFVLLTYWMNVRG